MYDTHNNVKNKIIKDVKSQPKLVRVDFFRFFFLDFCLWRRCVFQFYSFFCFIFEGKVACSYVWSKHVSKTHIQVWAASIRYCIQQALTQWEFSYRCGDTLRYSWYFKSISVLVFGKQFHASRTGMNQFDVSSVASYRKKFQTFLSEEQHLVPSGFIFEVSLLHPIVHCLQLVCSRLDGHIHV